MSALVVMRSTVGRGSELFISGSCWFVVTVSLTCAAGEIGRVFSVLTVAALTVLRYGLGRSMVVAVQLPVFTANSEPALECSDDHYRSPLLHSRISSHA
jgi:hypothetical protein